MKTLLSLLASLALLGVARAQEPVTIKNEANPGRKITATHNSDDWAFNTKPVVSPDLLRRAANARHKRDDAKQRISDLNTQYMQMLSQDQSQLTTAQSEVDATEKEITTGVDAKAWAWSWDSLDFSAVKAPDEKGAAPKPQAEQQAKR